MAFRRTILKQELAIQLFPNSSNSESAMQLLRKEIRRNTELEQQLFEKDHQKRVHYFTHNQLEVLLTHFGITLDEFEQLATKE